MRLAKPATQPDTALFLVRPVRQAAGLERRTSSTPSALGRSHRGALGKAKLAEAIERTHALLRLPADYRLGIVPASDTGAMEMAIWSLLGTRPVTMLAWESFGAGWVTDVAKQLKLDADIRTADYGEIADLGGIDPASDIVFTWNGTTSGVRVPERRLDRGRPHRPHASATRPRRRSRRTSTGPRSMSAPSAGRRRSAARRRTACSCSARARSSGSSASPRRGRCPRSSA